MEVGESEFFLQDEKRIRGAKLRKDERAAEPRDPECVKGAVAAQAGEGGAPRGAVGEAAQAVREPGEGDAAVEGGGEGVAGKEPEERVVGEESADGYAEGEAGIGREADGGGGADLERGRDDVGDERADGRVVGAAAEPGEGGAEDDRRQGRRRVEQHVGRGGGEGAEDDGIAPPDVVGQPAAERAAEEGAEGVGADRPRGGGLRMPAAGEIDGEEGPDERPEAVDEGASEEHPELPRKGAEVGEQRGGRGHLESAPAFDLQLGMIDPHQLPVPRFPTPLPPREKEGAGQGVDPLHHERGDRAALAGDAHRDADFRAAVADGRGAGFALDGEEKELPKDRARIVHDILFVMAPAVGVILRDEPAHLVPILPFHRFEKMPGMQPHLPFRLPEPRGVEPRHDERDGGDEHDFLTIHERD